MASLSQALNPSRRLPNTNIPSLAGLTCHRLHSCVYIHKNNTCHHQPPPLNTIGSTRVVSKFYGSLPSPTNRATLRYGFPRAPHLRVAAESWPPHVEVFSEGGHSTARGPMSNLLIALSKSLNFTYSIVQGDGYWGALQANGSWNGMIGLLLTKKADIGLGPFGISPVRFEVVDFTVPVFSQNLYALVSRPKPEPEVWGFLSPFTWYVWFSLLISSVLTSAVSTASARALEAEEMPTAFLNHLLISYQIFIGQGVSIMPKSSSLRLTMLLWLVFVFVVTRSYSGSMTSLLAAKTITIKYNSIRDILDDPSMQIMMESATVLSDHVQLL
ncbi:probable glutamate receptor [Macrobrachium nipponense]|uniref:probable glutamate receptor n=1 Tax=Macrobrachium nipponense TaxID=159736 RepID=UPI0030C7ED13